MKIIFATLLAFSFVGGAYAEQSTTEAAAAKANDVKRDLKKKGHHVEEALCAEGDAACLAKKAKHRGQEGVDYTKDKTKESMDKMDSDGKAH